MLYMLLIWSSGQVQKSWPVIHQAVKIPLLSSAEAAQPNANSTESGVKSALIASVSVIKLRPIAHTTGPEMLQSDLEG